MSASRRTLLTLLVALATLAIGFALGSSWRGTSGTGVQIGGSEVPDENFTLDFDKTHDLYCSNGGEMRAFRQVKVVGLTGTASFRGGGLFNRWLVLQYPDGRKVYVPPHAVLAIEEPPAPAKKP